MILDCSKDNGTSEDVRLSRFLGADAIGFSALSLLSF